MPHRVRLKNLQRKGELTEKDIDRIFKALEQEPTEKITNDVWKDFKNRKARMLEPCEDAVSACYKKGKALLNQRVGRLLPKKNLDVLFAYYALQKPLAELQNGTGATTVKHLSHGDIKKLIVLMPPTKEEQSAIAEVLSDVDLEIEQLQLSLAKYMLVKQVEKVGKENCTQNPNRNFNLQNQN